MSKSAAERNEILTNVKSIVNKDERRRFEHQISLNVKLQLQLATTPHSVSKGEMILGKNIYYKERLSLNAVG